MASSRDNSGSAGFTLLELVVAMALTGLLTMVIFLSLNLTLKARGRSQAAAEWAQQWRVSQAILERSLSSAVSGAKTNPQKKAYFVGGGNELRLLTVVPLEAHNLGGYYHFRVLVGQDESGQGCLAVEQTKIVNWRKDPQAVDVRQILIRNLESLRLTYGLGGEEFRSWDGEGRERLPDWIRVELALRGQAPQVWVIELHTAGSEKEGGAQGQ
jgi:prepilin-type N-terminal cleavage/methylation domain-containing protein